MLQQSILTTLRKFPSITLTHFARIVGDKAKAQTQKEGSKKKKQTEFSEKRKTYVCVSGGKKCSFFGKLLVFPPFLRFALSPYHTRNVPFQGVWKWKVDVRWVNSFMTKIHFI